MVNKLLGPWKELAGRWKKYYTPPGQPSKDDQKTYLKYVKKVLKNKKEPKVLVLGVTPELRDLLAKTKAEVTIIDILMEMILAMGQLTKIKNDKEIIVKANWIENPLADNYYDLIVGDLVICNIAWKDKEKFLKKLQKLLKPGGYWLTRIQIMPRNWQFKETDTILEEFSKKKMSRQLQTEMFNHFLYNSFNPRTKKVYTSYIKKEISKYWKGNKFKHSNKKLEILMNRANEMWSPFVKEWAFTYEDEYKKLIEKIFELKEKNISNDYLLSETFPIYLWRIKNKK